MPTRRHALCCAGALAAGLFTGLLPRAGAALANPCRGPLPAALARHEIVQSAFEGIDPQRLVDVHAHLLGTGDSGSGCSVHPSMSQWWHPTEVLRRQAILNGACVAAGVDSVDRAYVERLRRLAADFPAGARWWLFAFAQACDDQGRVRPDQSTFHVPDTYAAQVARAEPSRFDWVASIHPYRTDAIERLESALAAGAAAVKWLPSAMNIDLRDPRCRPFYARLAAAGVPLIVHCGEERAVPGAHREELGNPLLVRHALAAGVRVIVAHAASLGMADDTDRRSRSARPAFELFARLMGEADGRGGLMADISAVFQSNRGAAVWTAILEREDWHPRLLHGSDYPLPGVMPLFSLAKLERAGLLAAADVAPLTEVREHNPLLFDFVLKRRLRVGATRLPASVFEGWALSARSTTVSHHRPLP